MDVSIYEEADEENEAENVTLNPPSKYENTQTKLSSAPYEDLNLSKNEEIFMDASSDDEDKKIAQSSVISIGQTKSKLTITASRSVSDIDSVLAHENDNNDDESSYRSDNNTWDEEIKTEGGGPLNWVQLSEAEFSKWRPNWIKPFEEMYGLNYENLPPLVKDKILNNTVTPLDCFALYLDNDILEYMTKETNRYAFAHLKKLNDEKRNIPIYLKRFVPFEPRDVLLYIACLLYMGLVQMPSKSLHWNRDGFFPKTVISQVMTRERFDLVSKFHHLADEETADKNDKLYKVRPFITKLIKNWQKYYKCSRDITIDEKMIRFNGALKFKQHIPSKPVKNGIKTFLLCEATSAYTYNEEIYTGTVLGDSPSSTINIMTKLLDGFANKGHRLFVDNYFTSYELIIRLEKLMIGVSGTLRKNRKNIPKPICEGKLKSSEFMAYKLGNMVAFAWRDNKKCVRFMTNMIGGFSDTSGRNLNVKIKKPLALLEYNQNKFGVDLANQLEKQYQFNHRDLKWWKRVFISFIDTSIVNALIIYNDVKNKILPQMDFRKDMILEIFKICKQGFYLTFVETRHEIGRRKPSACVVCRKKELNKTEFYCKACLKSVCPEHFTKLHKISKLEERAKYYRKL